MMIDLGGRNALVVGGTGDLGTEICFALHRAGAMVVALGSRPDGASAQRFAIRCEQEQASLQSYHFDASSYEVCSERLAAIAAMHGPIEILVNAVGITRDSVLQKMTADAWQEVMSVNVGSVWNVTRCLIDGMVQRKYGRIVNISSINGQKGQYGQVNYSASKAAIHGLTMALAQEVARHNITVNTVSPGYFDTAMVRAVPDSALQRIVAGIPARRLGHPPELASLITYLCSQQASYISGANIPINGGLFISA